MVEKRKAVEGFRMRDVVRLIGKEDHFSGHGLDGLEGCKKCGYKAGGVEVSVAEIEIGGDGQEL